jgi:hypothetical protein
MSDIKTSSSETSPPVTPQALNFVVAISDVDGSSNEKGIFRREIGPPSLHEIPTAVLKENITTTIQGLRQLFDVDSSDQDQFSLRKVQVSFEVTASGKIALLGTSAELSGSGGITLTFER